MRNRTALATAGQPSTPVNFDVPAGAGDCHTHIHGHPERFPFFAGRTYTPELAPLLQIDDGRLLNQLPVWAPDAAVRKKILVDNPARLYGF